MSKDCWILDFVVMLHHSKGRDMIGEVKCINEKCGKIFIGTSRARYCSKKCQMAYLRAIKKLEINEREDKRGDVGA